MHYHWILRQYPVVDPAVLSRVITAACGTAVNVFFMSFLPSSLSFLCYADWWSSTFIIEERSKNTLLL